MHMADLSLGSLGANGVVGGGLPLAVGAGLSLKMKGGDQVVICYFGDGASNEGAFHESVNMAAIWKLPVIYLCENNQYAMSMPVGRGVSAAHISDRAVGYGIPGLLVDGMDVLAVYQAASELVEAARQGEGPATLVCQTIRYGGHHVGEPGTAYRTKEEMDAWRARDAIIAFEKKLVDKKVLTPQQVETTRDEVDRRVHAAVDKAREDPFPEVKEVTEHVYA